MIEITTKEEFSAWIFKKGYTYQYIAEKLHVSPRTVGSWMYRGLSKKAKKQINEFIRSEERKYSSDLISINLPNVITINISNSLFSRIKEISKIKRVCIEDYIQQCILKDVMNTGSL